MYTWSDLYSKYIYDHVTVDIWTTGVQKVHRIIDGLSEPTHGHLSHPVLDNES